MPVRAFRFQQQIVQLRHKLMLRAPAATHHNGAMADNEFSAAQWWQSGVVYQIYPRSFQDTNGDGVGDLRGITARLDYLANLGIDAIWISPFYQSPMADFGYDVSNYCAVDPLFGTLADFDELLNAAHSKGLRVILDFVPNHTSDQHAWFLDSCSSRDSAKRDWYLWHDAAPAGDDWKPARERVPNNWTSAFGGSAWEWDETTEQFYLHSFLKEQPDLNWRNPEVRQGMYDAMRFWLDRGIDGFRMDVLWLLIKDEFFRNNPPNPNYQPWMHDNEKTIPVFSADQPETHVIVREMRCLLDTYPDTLRPAPCADVESPVSVTHVSHRLLIGEIYLPLPELVKYYGGGSVASGEQPSPQLAGANLPFNFHLIQTAWNADSIAHIISNYEQLLPSGAWPNYVLGNHDQPRLASRIGAKQARAAAMLLLTLRGTPTLYYGDELGMEDVSIPPDRVQDPAEKNEPGKGRGRDPERTPMLWLNAPNAGFAPPNAQPWLPLSPDWQTRNAAAQQADSRSMLTLYARLLQLRRAEEALHGGAITDIETDGPVLKYRRCEQHGPKKFQLLLNLSADIAKTHCASGTVILTTLLDGEGAHIDGEVTLEAGEGLLVQLA
jgi:alpha-glucosidase